MLEDIPKDLKPHILLEYHVRGGPVDFIKGLELRNAHGTAVFIMTRQQLLDLAHDCQTAAEAMPKPS